VSLILLHVPTKQALISSLIMNYLSSNTTLQFNLSDLRLMHQYVVCIDDNCFNKQSLRKHL